MAVTVYLPTTFPSDFKEYLKRAGVRTVEVNDPARICQSVYSTGVLVFKQEYGKDFLVSGVGRLIDVL